METQPRIVLSAVTSTRGSRDVPYVQQSCWAGPYSQPQFRNLNRNSFLKVLFSVCLEVDSESNHTPALSSLVCYRLSQGWRLPKLSINSEAFFSRARGNSGEQNKVFVSSIIFINYCVIINEYYNYTV